MGLASYNSVAFFGGQGSGKTFAMIKLALKLATVRKRGIVSNLNFNVGEIYNYGVKYKNDWLKQICDDNCITSLPGNYEQDLLFRYPYRIVCFDEAGILLNSRSWQKNNKSILFDGNQLRKRFCTFLWTAQYADMTDKTLRSSVERCAWCEGTSYFNPDKQIDILVWKDVKFFKSEVFWGWVDDPVEKKLKPVPTFLKTTDRYWGPLDAKDKDLFNCYNSHDLIGSEVSRPLPPIYLPRRYRCEFPSLYYYCKCPQKGAKNWEDPILRSQWELIDFPDSPDSISALAYEFSGEKIPLDRRQEIVDWEYAAKDSIESLSLEFCQGLRDYVGWVKRKKPPIPNGYFETEKLLPLFKGWENYNKKHEDGLSQEWLIRFGAAEKNGHKKRYSNKN